MTKDEALQMCLEYIETDAHERKYVRHAIKAALAQPEQEPVACVTPQTLIPAKVALTKKKGARSGRTFTGRHFTPPQYLTAEKLDTLTEPAAQASVCQVLGAKPPHPQHSDRGRG